MCFLPEQNWRTEDYNVFNDLASIDWLLCLSAFHKKLENETSLASRCFFDKLAFVFALA
jgi:hypothetical protein